MAALLPEPPQRAGRLLGPLQPHRLDGPPERLADVPVLRVATVQPFDLVLGDQVRLGLDGQGEVVLAVSPQHEIEVAPLLELLLPELPDRLEHGETDVGTFLAAAHQ